MGKNVESAHFARDLRFYLPVAYSATGFSRLIPAFCLPEEKGEFMTYRTKKLALTALMSALAAALTLVSVPLPGGGYYNFGDVAIFIAAAALGPLFGAFVGGLGGALGDLILCYTFYAPFTLVIKAIEGLLAGALFKVFKKAFIKKEGRVKKVFFSILSNLAGGLVMAAGYFLAEGLLLAEGKWQGGLVNLPWNVLQGAVSAAVAPVILFVCRLENVINKTLNFPRKKSDGGNNDGAEETKEERENTDVKS